MSESTVLAADAAAVQSFQAVDDQAGAEQGSTAEELAPALILHSLRS